MSLNRTTHATVRGIARRVILDPRASVLALRTNYFIPAVPVLATLCPSCGRIASVSGDTPVYLTHTTVRGGTEECPQTGECGKEAIAAADAKWIKRTSYAVPMGVPAFNARRALRGGPKSRGGIEQVVSLWNGGV
jgi:hypothetical protein